LSERSLRDYLALDGRLLKMLALLGIEAPKEEQPKPESESLIALRSHAWRLDVSPWIPTMPS